MNRPTISAARPASRVRTLCTALALVSVSLQGCATGNGSRYAWLAEVDLEPSATGHGSFGAPAQEPVQVQEPEGSDGPQDPERTDEPEFADDQPDPEPPQVLDAVAFQEVLEPGWERRAGGFRIRGAGAIGGTGFDASGSPLDRRSGEYFGGVFNFRSEVLWAPTSSFEIGPRVLIGGRSTEFDDDDRLDYDAFDLFGELVARVYFGDLRKRSIRPYVEAFGGGGLEIGQLEIRENNRFSSSRRRQRDTGGVFTFGGGGGIEWIGEDSLYGTVGLEVRSVQNFDAPFFDSEIRHLDVAVVVGLGYSL